MMNKIEFASRLQQSLKISEISVKKMAALLRCSETSVRNYINGRILPRPSYITIWAKETGADEDWFYEGLYGPRQPKNW